MALACSVQAESPAVLTTTVDGSVRSFSIEDLQAMPVASFSTETIWTEGLQTFEGVPLAALLEELEVSEGIITVQAINDYSVDIPFDEIEQDVPVVAYHTNGAPMSRRDKGPLWLVYPYDSNPDYQAEVVFSRSIWQMDRLKVEH